MGWSIGYDSNWKRDVGYGVPATCDHPGCGKEIDRGLDYVCGGDIYGGEHGCGLFFCGDHRAPSGGDDGDWAMVCERCRQGEDAERFDPTPDTGEWLAHKLGDEGWQEWRDANPDWVGRMQAALVKAEQAGTARRDVNQAHPAPKPEGEAVAWRYCPECGSEDVRYAEGDHKQCGQCHQEWFADIDYSDVVQKNLARLYAHPAPEPVEGIREAIHGWLREDTSLVVKMNITPETRDKLVARISALQSRTGGLSNGE